MPPNEFPLWRGDERIDGMRVCRAIDVFDTVPDEYSTTWIVAPPDHRAVIRSCPCCVGIIRTRRAAQLLADRLYPAAGGTA